MRFDMGIVPIVGSPGKHGRTRAVQLFGVNWTWGNDNARHSFEWSFQLNIFPVFFMVGNWEKKNGWQ